MDQNQNSNRMRAAEANDILNIAGDLVPDIDPVLDQLLERGKTQRAMILAGTESVENRNRRPYAMTHVEIAFDNEDDLRKCVRLLRWSDDRLRARPDQLILWSWDATYREGMTIYFGVAWYNKEFFERRKDAFMEPNHAEYYSHFGARPDDFRMHHEVLEQ